MLIPIRCVNEKKHGMYDSCGALLGAIDENGVYFHCPNCSSKMSKWFRVFFDETGGVHIERLPKEIKLNFEDEIKMVEYGPSTESD